MTDAALLLDTERQAAAWQRAQGGAPGVELHDDPDVVWTLTRASAWSNCGVLVRMSEDTVRPRLRALHDRYEAHGRGMGLWVSPAATPASLASELRRIGVRCRKRYPAMACEAEALLPTPAATLPIDELDDIARLRAHGHPAFGPVSTPRRVHGVAMVETVLARRPRVAWAFVARDGEAAVGCAFVHVADGVAGIFDVAVRPSHQRRGLGRALVHRACAHSFAQGATRAVLIASGEGEAMYPHVGFREVGRLAYWYKSFQREA